MMTLRPIITPSPTDVEGIKMIHISFNARKRVFGPILPQSQVCKDPKPQPREAQEYHQPCLSLKPRRREKKRKENHIPIRIRHLPSINTSQPPPDIPPLHLSQRLPKEPRRNSKRKPNGTHLNHALVQILNL